MAFCSHCGGRLPDGAANCPACGAAVDGNEAEVPENEQALSIDPGLTAEVKQLAGEGRKIEAIKQYREATGAGLKEAKDAVEFWMRAEGLMASAGKGCATSVLLLGLFFTCGLIWLL